MQTEYVSIPHPLPTLAHLNRNTYCILVESSITCLNRSVQKHDIPCQVLGAECIGTSHSPLTLLFFIAIDPTVRR
ncbi:hypothetical protein M9434_001125 [Picochlorum sp. BPE23]|nr:hypothetical protein M9434_001125 [Picochlorum sp. BPE23]